MGSRGVFSSYFGGALACILSSFVSLSLCVGAEVMDMDAPHLDSAVVDSKDLSEGQDGYKSSHDNLEYKYIESDGKIDEENIVKKQKGLQDAVNGDVSNAVNSSGGASQASISSIPCNCQLMQECRAGICIFYCNCGEGNLSLIKYTFNGVSIREAYLARLEIASSKELLEPTPPSSNLSTQHGNNIIVEYIWEGEKRLRVTIYENNTTSGYLIFEEENGRVTAYDTIAWVK